MVSRWGGFIHRLRELFQDLKAMFQPSDETRDWGKIEHCQRTIRYLESVIDTAEVSGRWSEDPNRAVDRLACELQELQEGRVEPYVQRMQIIKKKAMIHWGSIDFQDQY
jgi:uncharacterized coiled-coil DUF342 family protein